MLKFRASPAISEAPTMGFHDMLVSFFGGSPHVWNLLHEDMWYLKYFGCLGSI